MSDIHLPKFEERHYPDEKTAPLDRVLWRKVMDLEFYIETLRKEIEFILKDHENALKEDDGK